MKRSSISPWFLLLFIFLAGCSFQEANADVSIKGASQFSQWLSYQRTENGVLLFIKDPDHKSPTRVLYCTSNPEEINPSFPNAEVVDTRQCSIATNASTHVGMMVSLNVRANVGAVSLGRYLYDPALKTQFNEGKLMEIGSANIPFEALSKQKITLWVSAGMEALDPANAQRFKSLSILWVPNYDWREEHPLGKAEWLLFFGALTNRFDEAVRQFKAICVRYKTYQEKYPRGNQCAKVLVGNFAGDFWYSPLQNSYQAQFLSSADFCTFSMHYKGTGSMAVGTERIYKEAEGCELWLNPGFPSKTEILSAFPNAKKLKPFRQGKVYCYSHDLNKFWEQSALKPDLVLRDLIRIKNKTKTDSSLYFYREVK